MMAIRFIKPLYFCVGDSPESIEIWRIELGVKERQLLCLRGGHSYFKS